MQSDVQSKSDKSPVTIADYGIILSIAFNFFFDCVLFFDTAGGILTHDVQNNLHYGTYLISDSS